MDVVVIGGGAAGMFSAIISAKEGNNVTLIEKNATLGNKIKITGKGRCNLTFDGDIEDLKKNIVKNYKFMYGSFSKFSNKDLVEYFNKIGVKTKVERGGRVFPVSDKATDIVKALEGELKKYNVKILLNSRLKDISVNGSDKNIILDNGNKIRFDKCIIATGGKSYKVTGSTGDGYNIARKLGHNIVDIKPGLVPLKSNSKICTNLQGLSLKNVKLKILVGDDIIYEDFGEMLFAHFGITGPLVLSSSSKLNRVENIDEKLSQGVVKAIIDLKPALDDKKLDLRICRDFEKYNNKEFRNALNDLLPQKLIPVVIDLTKIDPAKKVNQITKKERYTLLNVIKNFQVNIIGFMPLDMAIVTCGGIDVKEVDPKTLMSKKVPGIYFAGEILDIDAYTGGYNLQIAFSTAYSAGKNN